MSTTRWPGGDDAGDRLRVLYVVSLFPCWSETFIAREIEALLRLGVDVRILSLKDASEELVQPEAAALLDRVLYATRMRAPAWPKRRILPLALSLARNLRRHPRAIAKSLVTLWRTEATVATVASLAPDAIHAHWATYPSTAALLLSRLTGIPFSFTGHAHDIFLEDHLLGVKLREAAFAVTISDFNRRLLESRHGTAATRKLNVLHCGVPLERFPFQPAGREPGRVLAVGRLDPIKGFDVLIDACGILVEQGVAFSCDIVGDGPLRGELEAQIARHRLGTRVRLLGALPEGKVRRLLYSATAFALPSVVTGRGDMDGIPVALMEAMASGAPVVSTTVSGIPELVQDGKSGRLVAAGNALALADAVGELLASGARRESLATEARRVVECSFDVSHETARLHALLRGAAGKKS